MMLTIIVLSIIILSAIILSIIMLTIIMLNVIMLSVILPSNILQSIFTLSAMPHNIPSLVRYKRSYARKNIYSFGQMIFL